MVAGGHRRRRSRARARPFVDLREVPGRRPQGRRGRVQDRTPTTITGSAASSRTSTTTDRCRSTSTATPLPRAQSSPAKPAAPTGCSRRDRRARSRRPRARIGNRVTLVQKQGFKKKRDDAQSQAARDQGLHARRSTPTAARSSIRSALTGGLECGLTIAGTCHFRRQGVSTVHHAVLLRRAASRSSPATRDSGTAHAAWSAKYEVGPASRCGTTSIRARRGRGRLRLEAACDRTSSRSRSSSRSTSPSSKWAMPVHAVGRGHRGDQ